MLSVYNAQEDKMEPLCTNMTISDIEVSWTKVILMLAALFELVLWLLSFLNNRWHVLLQILILGPWLFTAKIAMCQVEDEETRFDSFVLVVRI